MEEIRRRFYLLTTIDLFQEMESGGKRFARFGFGLNLLF